MVYGFSEGDFVRIEKIEIYDFIEPFLEQVPVVDVTKGEYIVRHGEKNVEFNKYYVLRGNVRILKCIGDKRVWVDEVGPDHFVGDYSRVFEQFLDCDILATENTRLLCITDQLFYKLLGITKFEKVFYRKMSQRVYLMYKKLLFNQNYTQKEIIASYILKNAKNDHFVCSSTDILAEELGLNKRNLYNVLRNLMEDGIIEKQANFITIINKEVLIEQGARALNYMV